MLDYRKSNEKKWGYMDESGKAVIEPQFTGTQSFSEGRAIVNVEKNYGAAGFPTFTIPFAQINNILNKDGDFWRSFH
ncbi:WG repeat-containing protein [Neobacillus vireti]|uniref:WG repeat-containing protein n=1 Tax=Neobacillus vireti TaxID=220686 RepID=UPI002FFF9E38